MEKLIIKKIHEYDPKIKKVEISYSNRPQVLDDLIVSYKGRNKMAKDKNIKELTSKILTNLVLIKERSVKYLKFVVVRENNISRLFFFNEDYSEIFFDFTFPIGEDLKTNEKF